jgi:hypothetical protein
MTFYELNQEQSEFLYSGARADERFRVIVEEPTFEKRGGNDFSYKHIYWSTGFSSYIVLWFIRWYYGNYKCDGTRTRVWNTRYPGYVVTPTPKEKFSFRIGYKKPDRERWDNMGGI